MAVLPLSAGILRHGRRRKIPPASRPFHMPPVSMPSFPTLRFPTLRFPTLRFPTKRAFPLCAAWSAIVSAAVATAESPAGSLPFAPERISRLSLDGKPRSLAIRQGPDIWLGYDLERATLLKVWQASPGKPGLIKSGFTTRSSGTSRFEDASDAGWQLQRGRSTVPLAVRYLGCSHCDEHVELRWELRHDTLSLRLFERVPFSAATEPVASEPAASEPAGEAGPVVRELRVEGLPPGDSLLPPATIREAWKLADHAAARNDERDTAQPSLSGDRRHRFTLP